MNTTLFDGGFLHGGDYNPDQWLDCPEILEQDIEMMKKAHINCVSLGIFSWSLLEPQENVYDFDWLEKIINNLYKNGIYTILGTPSGAKPFWMSEKYPEIRRCDNKGVRDASGSRHNHCMTSPIYREFTRKIDTALSQRFANNPAIIMWHIGNEFSGECFCPSCTKGFRDWLKAKYNTLDKLNHDWCTAFWSHIFTDFSQIYPPLANGECHIHGLNADWKRYMADMTVDFIKCEVDAVKSANPNIPATTNLMGFFGYNYFKLKDVIDVISWDSYPTWHTGDDVAIAMQTAAQHDIMRSIKPNKPFLLMESTPSTTNWWQISKLKRPNVHMAASLQAIAHGSDSVQYFQIRKARGNIEKFHGAVIDHSCRETRVYNDVVALGKRLTELSDIQGSTYSSEVAIVFDYENRFSLNDSNGPRNIGLDYEGDIYRHYAEFWKRGINVDLVSMDSEISGYKLVVAPMLYMYRNGFETKMREFVQNGGTLVGTYHSGIVDEHDLCYLGDIPGGKMNEVFGIWNEETDALCNNDRNSLITNDGKEYAVERLCAIIHAQTAEVLAHYGADFYKDTPALTLNKFGKGQAYYIAAATVAENSQANFFDDFYAKIITELSIKSAVDADLPYGVSAHTRIDKDNNKYIFIENYSGKTVDLPLKHEYNIFNGEKVSHILLKDYDVIVLTEIKS